MYIYIYSVCIYIYIHTLVHISHCCLPIIGGNTPLMHCIRRYTHALVWKQRIHGVWDPATPENQLKDGLRNR